MKKGLRRTAVILVVLLALGGIGAGFVYRPRPLLVVALDSAFAALRPQLVDEISRPELFGNRLELLVLPVDSAAQTLLRDLERKKLRPAAIAASPLVARALVEGAARNGSTPPEPVIGLEWDATPDQSLRPSAALLTDPLPAARRLGTTLGSLLSKAKAGESASSSSAEGAMIWEAGPGRPEAEKEAFIETFTASAGFPPLVLELAPDSADADTLLRGLFAKDIRAAFIDAGSFGPAALDLAEHNVSAIAYASGAPEETARAWPSTTYLVAPDDRAFADFLRSARSLVLRGDMGIPALVERSSGGARSRILGEEEKSPQKRP